MKLRGIRPTVHPACQRCSSVEYAQNSQSSRLAIAGASPVWVTRASFITDS